MSDLQEGLSIDVRTDLQEVLSIDGPLNLNGSLKNSYQYEEIG